MGPQSMGVLGVAGLFAAAVAYVSIDRSLNYVDTKAEVDSVKIDCFIKSGKKSVVQKDTSALAYMDCDMAPAVAAQFGHDASAIKVRASIEYTYKSPVDGAYHTGKYADSGAAKDKYTVGQSLQIKAHVKDAGKSIVVR